jgi:NADH-quinone oxidoreductase subunit C
MANETPATSSPVAPAPPSGNAPATTATAAPPKPAAPTTPPPEPKPNPLPHVDLPFQGVDYALRGVHAEATIAPADVIGAAQKLDCEGFSLDTITGVDWIAAAQMEVVYDFFHYQKNLRVVVRTRVPRETPELPSIHQVFPGANWHERETHDFFGIRFLGHPNLAPFLLPEDATYHPLKKDFTS